MSPADGGSVVRAAGYIFSTTLMKHLLLGLLGLGPACLAQSTKFSGHLTSGLGAFRGSGASEAGIILVPDDGLDDFVYLYTTRNVPYAENPYGKKVALSYGGALQVQRVTRGQTVLGAQAGYDFLRSRVPVVLVFDQSDAGTNVSGRVILTSQATNLHPFVGYRFRREQLSFDLTAGPEAAYLLRSHESSRANTPSNRGTVYKYSTSLNREHPRLDVRARLNLTAYYQRVGLSGLLLRPDRLPVRYYRGVRQTEVSTAPCGVHLSPDRLLKPKVLPLCCTVLRAAIVRPTS